LLSARALRLGFFCQPSQSDDLLADLGMEPGAHSPFSGSSRILVGRLRSHDQAAAEKQDPDAAMQEVANPPGSGLDLLNPAC
jgi:hypothetical protein